MITFEQKHNIRIAVLNGREKFKGTDTAYAKSLGIDSMAYDQIKDGQMEGALSLGQWLNIGSKFQTAKNDYEMKLVRTEVYSVLEDNFNFCQATRTSMILVDDCGIGKSRCAIDIISKMKNAFYVDCSQSHTKIRFVKQLAASLGCDTTGKYYDILETVKYALNIIENPFVCVDEFGDLEYNAYLELKGIMNATKHNCTWYAMGADGLRAKITKGINNHKVGFAEIFSRLSDDFVTLVPKNPEERKEFYLKLFGDVAYVNLKNKNEVNEVVKKCMVKVANPFEGKQKGEQGGRIKSLRYLETLLKVRE
ncbi:hypothetical protein KB553_09165 [Chryseobacterium rhizoplanae]|uniref:hypothetical protein n=1 Tax=Chryseobacterium rhizoplanae TaxID=1609531 RepID=UPI001CE2ADFE|nr:hypothetical protein [Chryseobacterium rhizoplanae]UCA61691.1 hypothetical protein KB553_09165 [Chryseobacterium rhizoplanae]